MIKQDNFLYMHSSTTKEQTRSNVKLHILDINEVKVKESQPCLKPNFTFFNKAVALDNVNDMQCIKIKNNVIPSRNESKLKKKISTFNILEINRNSTSIIRENSFDSCSFKYIINKEEVIEESSADKLLDIKLVSKPEEKVINANGNNIRRKNTEKQTKKQMQNKFQLFCFRCF